MIHHEISIKPTLVGKLLGNENIDDRASFSKMSHPVVYASTYRRRTRIVIRAGFLMGLSSSGERRSLFFSSVWFTSGNEDTNLLLIRIVRSILLPVVTFQNQLCGSGNIGFTIWAVAINCVIIDRNETHHFLNRQSVSQQVVSKHTRPRCTFH